MAWTSNSILTFVFFIIIKVSLILLLMQNWSFLQQETCFTPWHQPASTSCWDGKAGAPCLACSQSAPRRALLFLESRPKEGDWSGLYFDTNIVLRSSFYFILSGRMCTWGSLCKTNQKNNNTCLPFMLVPSLFCQKMSRILFFLTTDVIIGVACYRRTVIFLINSENVIYYENTEACETFCTHFYILYVCGRFRSHQQLQVFGNWFYRNRRKHAAPFGARCLTWTVVTRHKHGAAFAPMFNCDLNRTVWFCF